MKTYRMTLTITFEHPDDIPEVVRYGEKGMEALFEELESKYKAPKESLIRFEIERIDGE